jgi:hypothetical protein
MQWPLWRPQDWMPWFLFSLAKDHGPAIKAWLSSRTAATPSEAINIDAGMSAAITRLYSACPSFSNTQASIPLLPYRLGAGRQSFKYAYRTPNTPFVERLCCFSGGFQQARELRRPLALLELISSAGGCLPLAKTALLALLFFYGLRLKR